MRLSELNNLYKAAHYLKIGGLKKCCGAFLSCKVYMTLKK